MEDREATSPKGNMTVAAGVLILAGILAAVASSVWAGEKNMKNGKVKTATFALG